MSANNDIYKHFNINYDNNHNIINNNIFNLKYYQTLPKYYILDNNIQALLLDYGMGTGKTSTAVYTSLYYLNKLQRECLENRKTKNNKHKIFVIGAWTTINIFQSELLRPEFRYLNQKYMDEIYSDLKNESELVRNEANERLEFIKKNVYNNYEFVNFQSVFNLLFPNISEERYVQDIDQLMSAYLHKTIKPSMSFIDKLRDTIVIIDECQHMWNITGLNTYGFAIGILMKYAKEYNIKFLLLSGTPLNSSPVELVYMYSVFNPDKFVNVDEYLEDKKIYNQVVKSIIPSKKKKLLEFFKDKFLYFNPFSSSSTTKGLVVDNKFLNDNLKTNDKNLKYLAIKQNNSNLVTGYHIGHLDLEIINPYILHKQGYQKQVNKNRDGDFDPKANMHSSNGIWSGDDLKFEKLKNYSIIGYKMLELCYENNKRNEKVACYHDKIYEGGLLQYVEFLKINGYTLCGDELSKNSKCKTCLKTLDEHTKEQHKFRPLYYSIISGDTPEKERSEIVRIYNSPKNIDGDLISVLMLSSVAASGVSLHHTTNMIILSSISNITKLQQIVARIIRTRSHELLPKHLHLAKIYTLAVDEDIDKYKLRVELYNQINDIIQELYKNSVTEELFQLKMKSKSNLVYSEFIKDSQKEIKNIINLIKNNTLVDSIEENALLKFVGTLSKSFSYLNLNLSDKDFIKFEILKQSIKLLKNNDNNKYIYKFMNNNKKENYPSIAFDQMNELEQKEAPEKIDSENIQDSLIETELNKYIEYYGIHEVINKNIIPDFWTLIYRINNEYYDDDDKNFLYNHSTKGRDIKRMTGMYYGNHVILKSGETIEIKQMPKKINPIQLKNNKILSLAITSWKKMANQWRLSVVLGKYSKDEIDNRKLSDGLKCISYTEPVLREILSELDIEIPLVAQSLRMFCYNLITIICDYCVANKIEIKTPFIN